MDSGSCNPFDGKCVCPPGYGGDDCSKPCESLRAWEHQREAYNSSVQCVARLPMAKIGSLAKEIAANVTRGGAESTAMVSQLVLTLVQH